MVLPSDTKPSIWYQQQTWWQIPLIWKHLTAIKQFNRALSGQWIGPENGPANRCNKLLFYQAFSKVEKSNNKSTTICIPNSVFVKHNHISWIYTPFKVNAGVSSPCKLFLPEFCQHFSVHSCSFYAHKLLISDKINTKIQVFRIVVTHHSITMMTTSKKCWGLTSHRRDVIIRGSHTYLKGEEKQFKIL